MTDNAIFIRIASKQFIVPNRRIVEPNRRESAHAESP